MEVQTTFTTEQFQKKVIAAVKSRFGSQFTEKGTKSHITGFPGPSTHIVFAEGGLKYSLVVYVTTEKVMIRLFKGTDPQKYYTGEKSFSNENLRKNNPFLLQFLYTNGKETWLDEHIPLSDPRLDTIHLVVKQIGEKIVRIYQTYFASFN